jgi:glycosyltransferase involved in cell wall biosynthesis
LLIDDCSEDNSINIAQKYHNLENLKIIKNKKNIGLVKSCNKAIKLCKTKYIVRIDSDDYVKKNFIAKFNTYTKKNYDFIFSNYLIKKKNKLLKKNLKKKNLKYLISCSVALKKSCLKKIGLYKNFFWEEIDLYIRYLKSYNNIKHIKDYLYIYRIHKNNMTNSYNAKKKGWNQINDKYKKEDIKIINNILKN